MARTLQALVSIKTHLVLLLEADGTIAHASPSVTPLLGHAPRDVVGTNVLALAHPDDIETATIGLMLATGAPVGTARGEAPIGSEVRLRHRDGEWATFDLQCSNFSDDTAIRGLLVVGRPVNARRAFDDALTSLAYDVAGVEPLVKLVHYLDTTVGRTTSAIFTPDADPPWITERLPAELLTDDGPWQTVLDTGEGIVDRLGTTGGPLGNLQAAGRRAGMRSCWCLPVPLRTLRSGTDPGDEDRSPLGCLVLWSTGPPEQLEGSLGVITKAAELAELALRRRRESRKLEQLATYDLVTGTLNRAGFEALLAELGDDAGCLAIIDLDDFKEVNDGHGHPVGDRILRTTAERILSVLRPDDVLARLGGDEFVLRLAGHDLDAITGVADAIVEVTAEPVVVDGTSVSARVSVGVAPYRAGTSRREQIARADKALYQVKRNGKGGWQLRPG